MEKSQTVSVNRDELQRMIRAAVMDLPPMEMPAEARRLAVLRERKALTTREVADLYGMSESTLEKMRATSDGPHFIQDGKKITYLREDVEKYLVSRRVKTYAMP